MRVAICLLLLVSACTEKKAPAIEAPAVSEDELQRFLNGMLVTSATPPATELVWPFDSDVLTDTPRRWMEKNYDFKSLEDLRAFIDVPPEQMTRSHAWVFGRLNDWASELQVWKQLLKEDKNDLEAALAVARRTESFDGVKAAIESIASVSSKTARILDERGSHHTVAELDGYRCSLLLRARRLAEAEQACRAAIAVDDSWGSRTLANVLLAMGRHKEGLDQIQKVAALPGRGQTYHLALTHGLAQQLNGNAAQAQAIWKTALIYWPNDPLLLRAASGEKRSVYEWVEDEERTRRPNYERWFALCGHHYVDLGLEARSQECYRRSELLGSHYAPAQKLVHLGEKDLEAALAKAQEIVKPDSYPDLLTAMAWLQLKKENIAGARQWNERALKWMPWDVKAMSMMWRICGKEKNYLCVIDYRKRLGLPTHFNVAEYKDVARAWKEQALKNGEGLAAGQPDSERSARPPRIEVIEIVPMGTRVPPELTGLVEALKDKFAGVKLELAPVEPLPDGAYKPSLQQVVWENLVGKLGSKPGRLFIIEDDLMDYDSGFAFARFDLENGRGVLSLSRLRSLSGEPTPASTTLDETLVTAARARLLGEVGGAIGMLLGVSFPCPAKSCAMHERRSVLDFAANGFCEKHDHELRKVLGGRKTGTGVK